MSSLHSPPSLENGILRHIAIIMDGNGRWALERGLPRVNGHQKGVEAIRTVVRTCIEKEVKILTLYAFSQENWKRPAHEIRMLMKLLDYFLTKELKSLKRQGISFRVIGRINGLPPAIQRKIHQVIKETLGGNKLILNVALNYGSRGEIVDAAKQILADIKSGKVNLKDLSEELFAQYLYTKDLPDPDLLIRTSGEMRLSNFLLWQLSYSELYVTKKFWPAFGREDLLQAIREYQCRQRRFGDIGKTHAS